MSELEGKIQALARRAKARRRLQRFANTACTALLPALVLAAIAILLAKQGVLRASELGTALGTLGALVGVAALAAALWPISTLTTLVRLDAGNGFSDRLSSAWAFLQVTPEARTPEMALHLERTTSQLAGVDASRAYRLQRPRDAGPAALLLAVAVFTALLVEPSYDAPPANAGVAVAPAPRFILDLAALRPEIRQVEQLADLAEQSGDPALQEIADELESLLDRAERGVLSEDELLDELDRLERELAELETEPPPDLRDEWTEVADTLREILADNEVPEGLQDEVQDFLDALDAGDEAAVADALDQLRDLLGSEELSEEDLAALADALDALADAFDPSDFDLRQELDGLRDQLADLEQQMEGGHGGRRTQRALDAARERQGELEDQLGQSTEGQGEGGETRQEMADRLRDAADSLREEPSEAGAEEPTETASNDPTEGQEAEEPGNVGPETGSERESSEGQERPDERGTEPGSEPQEASAEDRDAGERAEGTPRDAGQGESQPQGAEGQQAGREGETPQQGEPGEPREGQPQGEPGQDQPQGEPSETASAEPGREQRPSGAPQERPEGQPGTRPEQRPQTPQERAADELEQAAEELRDRQRQDARAEGRERAEQATEGMRENLQRTTAEPSGSDSSDQMAEQNWEDFMDRAEGRPPSESPQSGQPGQEGEGGQEPPPGGEQPGSAQGEQASRDEGEPSGQGGQSWGTEAGGDALGQESTDLEAERERVDAEVEVGDEGAPGRPTTSEVIESAAVEGFASTAYRDVYQEYAAAVERALRSESIPPGYARFLERYFGLIEPRH